jgi:hypothetical protein
MTRKHDDYRGSAGTRIPITPDPHTHVCPICRGGDPGCRSCAGYGDVTKDLHGKLSGRED